MTTEAALTKLCYLLKKDLTVDDRRKLMQENLRGELTIFSGTSHDQPHLSNISVIPYIARHLRLASSKVCTYYHIGRCCILLL